MSASQLTSGDNSGCRVCQAINLALKDFELTGEDLKFELKYHVRGSQIAVQFKAQPDGKPDAIWAPLVVLEFYRLPHTAPGSSFLWDVQEASHISCDTSSPDALGRAQMWLNKCLTSHSVCGSQREAKLPTRIVDISKPDPFLYVSKGETTRYLCLSHCWGDLPHENRTEKATFDEHRVRIPPSHLSKTFRDAIDITRRLGFRYIWIDALCIVQDEKEDWKREAVKMGQYYSGATLVIAATSSSNGDGGCYSQAHEAFSGHIIPQHDLYVRQQSAHFFHGVDDLRRDYAHFPLLTRGWVFQERRLCPRMLHFTTNELMWECRSAIACECTPSPPPVAPLPGLETGIYATNPDPSDHEFFGAMDTLLWKLRSGFPATARYRVQSQADGASDGDVQTRDMRWWTQVEAYTALDFTFHTDRLIALAGLADVEAKLRPDDKYMYGLWKDTIITDLLWEIDERQGPGERPSEWIAPTWSWASIVASVDYQGNDSRPLKTVTLEGEPGVDLLCIAAPLFSGKLDYDPLKEVDLRNYYFVLDIPGAPALGAFPIGNGDVCLDYDVAEDCGQVSPGGQVFALPLVERNRGSRRAIAGLILKVAAERSQAPELPLFNRIGAWACWEQELMGRLESRRPQFIALI